MKSKVVALAAIVVMVSLVGVINPVAAQDEPLKGFVTPGPNKNVIGFTPNPNTLRIPDLFRKQQNEPSCVQSTDNPGHIFCGFNDCRASDWADVQGDCWIGTGQSGDFGETWTSRLAPGYLGHPYSLGMGFAADAAVSEIPGHSPGLMLMAYIVGHRDSDVSAIVVQRYAKSPREDGEPFLPEDRPPTIAATGSEGRFHDKVASIFIVNDDNPQSSTSEMIDVEGLSAPVAINRLNGVYVIAYSVFTGNGSAVKILTQYSTDGGQTMSAPKKVSDELNTVTGVHLAYLPGKGLSLTYRRSRDSNQFDAIVQAFSTSFAERWAKTQTVFEICPHDQQASGNAARMFTFPWGADDGERLWVFSADKVDPASGERIAALGQCTQAIGAPPGVYPGVSRIVGMSSLDGKNWYGSAENPDEPFVLDFNDGVGYQFFPFAQGAKNHVDIAFWDTREEEAIRPAPEEELPYIYDYVTSGGARVFRKASIFMTRISGCVATTSQGACTPRLPSDDGLLAPVRVSRYQTAGIGGILQEVEANPLNLPTHGSGKLAYNGDYGAFGTPRFRRLPSGKAIQNSLPQQPGETNFVANENTFVAWGENRDVFFGNVPALSGQFLYSPPVNAAPALQAPGYQASNKDSNDSTGTLLADEPDLKAVSEPDDELGLGPAADFTQCTAGSNFSRSRDSNVYGSLVEDVPSMVALTQARQMNLTQRMFPLVISNPGTERPGANFCLAIVNQPTDYLDGTGSGRASFDPLPARNDPDLFVAPRVLLDLLVSPLSSASRAAFVTSSDASTRIIVNAYKGSCPTTQNPDFGSLVSSVQLSDGQIFDPLFCQQNALDPACLDQPVATRETHNIVLLSPGLQAPGYQAPGFQAPVYQAPVYQAEGEEAPVLQAPSYQAPSLQADTLESNTLKSPGLQAPSFQAPSLQAAVEDDNVYYQDLTYLVETNANVTTTYSADIAVLGLNPDETSVELIAWQPNVHTTTAVVNDTCLALPEADNKVIASVDLGSPGLQAPSLQAVILPDAFSAENQNPYAGEISFAGKPGEQIALTVRLWVTGESKNQLDRLYECSTAEFPDPALNCLPEEIKSGAFLHVPFGAAAHGCSTVDVDNTDPNVDCISAGLEKIIPPDLFAPEFFPQDGGSVAHEADSPFGAVLNTPGTVPNGISVTDADPNVVVFCTADDVVLGDVTTQFPFGDTLVSCSATDTALNQSNADITISVVDLTPPTISVPAIIPDVEADGPDGTIVNLVPLLTVVDITDTTTDCTPSSGSTFALGTTSTTCTATDQGGNDTSVTFDITVSDTIDPTISVPATSVEADAADANGAKVNFDVAAMDKTNVEILCTIDNDTTVVMSGSLFPLGTTTVTCTATDQGYNTATGMFDVIVSDTGNPTITVPGPITKEATSSNGATVDFVVTASDDVDLDVGIQCTIDNGATVVTSGNFFAIRTTAVNCTATDDVGNTDSASFDVTVQDTTPPVVDVPDDLTRILDNANGAIVDFSVTATDIADPDPVVTCNPASGSLFPTGTTKVTCSATDLNGNTSANSSFDVKVELGTGGITLKSSAKSGSSNPVSWAWTNSAGAPVSIGNGNQKIEARAGNCPSNSADVLDEDPGSSGFQLVADLSWQYNWQLVNSQGQNLPTGPYCVRVTLLTTMQYMEANTKVRP